MELISKEDAYKAIEGVCNKYWMVTKWSGFMDSIFTCLDKLLVYDVEKIIQEVIERLRIKIKNTKDDTRIGAFEEAIFLLEGVIFLLKGVSNYGKQ